MNQNTIPQMKIRSFDDVELMFDNFKNQIQRIHDELTKCSTKIDKIIVKLQDQINPIKEQEITPEDNRLDLHYDLNLQKDEKYYENQISNKNEFKLSENTNLVINKLPHDDDEFEYYALNSLYSRLIYEISISTDTSYSYLSFMIFQYIFPFILQIISILVLTGYYTNLYYVDAFNEPFNSQPQGNEKELLTLISSPGWVATLFVSVMTSVFNMTKEQFNINVNLQMIDSFAERLPVTALMMRTVEILRTIFIILSQLCNSVPLSFAANTVQLLTETVVFVFILDFDNKLHKQMRGFVHRVKFRKNFSQNHTQSIIQVGWVVLTVCSVINNINNRVAYHEPGISNKTNTLIFGYINNTIFPIIQIFPFVQAFKFINYGNIICATLTLNLIWIIFGPLNVLFTVSSLIDSLKENEKNYESIIQQILLLTFQVTLSLQLLQESYFKPVNQFISDNEEDCAKKQSDQEKNKDFKVIKNKEDKIERFGSFFQDSNNQKQILKSENDLNLNNIKINSNKHKISEIDLDVLN